MGRAKTAHIAAVGARAASSKAAEVPSVLKS